MISEPRHNFGSDPLWFLIVTRDVQAAPRNEAALDSQQSEIADSDAAII
jgi:hypothetical protein